jgi:hypothetical protein
MSITTTNEWELSDKSGLVSVGSHSLFVSTCGPPRKSCAPVVVFITGGGVPTEFYVHLHYDISKFARNCFYDRAGYGRSERPASDDKNEYDEHNCTTGTAMNVEDHGDHAWWAPRCNTDKQKGLSINNGSLQLSMNGYSGKHSRKIWTEDSAS